MAEDNVQMTDDEILAFTQGVRKQIIQKVVANGIPDDPKSQMVLLAAAGDMDRQALTKKRLNNDNNNAAADREAQLAIASIYQQVGNRSPFEATAGNVLEGTVRVVEVPEKLVPHLELVPGEMDIGLKDLTYSQFMEDKS